MWASFQKEAGSAGEKCAPRRTRVRLVVHPGKSCYFSIKWLRQRRTIRQELSARDFVTSQGLENAGILYVFQVFQTAGLGRKIRRRPQTQLCGVALTPFYPANPSQAAGGGEKCMDLRFLRLRRWLLKQQPNKTVFNRFIENWYQGFPRKLSRIFS